MTAALLIAGLLVALQPKPPKIDEAKVDAAIQRGVLFLRSKVRKNNGTDKARELILLALHHSGVRKGDPLYDDLPLVASIDRK